MDMSHGAVAVLAIAIVLVLVLSKRKDPCPQCGSHKVTEEFWHDPGFSGMRRRPSTKTIRCRQCKKASTREIVPGEQS